MKNDGLALQIKELLKELHIPEVAVGVAFREKTFTTRIGITNVDRSLAVDDRTLFQIDARAPEPAPSVRYRFYDDDHIIGMDAPNIGDLA